MAPQWTQQEVLELHNAVCYQLAYNLPVHPAHILQRIRNVNPWFARQELAVRCKLVDVLEAIVATRSANLQAQIFQLQNQPPVVQVVPGPPDTTALTQARTELKRTEEDLAKVNALLDVLRATHDEDERNLEKLQEDLKTATSLTEKRDKQARLLEDAIAATADILKRLHREPELCEKVVALASTNLTQEIMDREITNLARAPATPTRSPLNIIGLEAHVDEPNTQGEKELKDGKVNVVEAEAVGADQQSKADPVENLFGELKLGD